MKNGQMAKKRLRLDIAMKELGLVETRSKAKALIMAGSVTVNHQIVSKAGHLVSEDDDIILKAKACPFVSRGGLKLQAALKRFNVNVESRICLDVGASTGGFTDCLLQNGATLVYAVDVGYGQLDWSLRNRKDVINLEKTNIRHVDKRLFEPPPDIAVVDVSFISLKLVLPAVLPLMRNDLFDIITLIKPQFEAGPSAVGKGGIVRNEEVRTKVVDELTDFFSNSMGLKVNGVMDSPIKGAKGNKEYLVHLSKGEGF